MAKNYVKNALNALNFSICDIEPLTKSQVLAFESEQHMVLHGCAGTGKTFISFYIGFDDIIKGLFSNRALPNGHQGYYHYYPNEDAYMTGKRPNNLSTPIFNNKLSKSKNAQKLKKVGFKISTNLISKGLNKVSHDTSEKIRRKSIKEIIKLQETLPARTSKGIAKLKAGVKEIKKAGKY